MMDILKKAWDTIFGYDASEFDDDESEIEDEQDEDEDDS